MALDPSSVVASYMSIQGEGVVWQPILIIGVFDWEIPWVAQLLVCLQEVRIFMGEVDRRVWRKGIGGVFSVKSCYEYVAGVVEAPSL